MMRGRLCFAVLFLAVCGNEGEVCSNDFVIEPVVCSRGASTRDNSGKVCSFESSSTVLDCIFDL